MSVYHPYTPPEADPRQPDGVPPGGMLTLTSASASRSRKGTKSISLCDITRVGLPRIGARIRRVGVWAFPERLTRGSTLSAAPANAGTSRSGEREKRSEV